MIFHKCKPYSLVSPAPRPQRFVILSSALFRGAGDLSYLAYGSNAQTVILAYFSSGQKFIQVVYFLYANAILLSIPTPTLPSRPYYGECVLPESACDVDKSEPFLDTKCDRPCCSIVDEHAKNAFIHAASA